MNPAAACSQADFSAALFDPARACPPGLFAWNGSDPAARLAVYRNNVIASLVDALADGFPVVQELVGAEFFRAMAAVFVRQTPPRTRVLAQYGDSEFPRFVAVCSRGPLSSRFMVRDCVAQELSRFSSRAK